jgi:hypothetical protein
MYYTNNPVCTAHISVNKNRVKLYKNADQHSVFLKDGQNFEIELYNPKQNSVLAKILLNGKPISSSGIVLRPGQRVFIERFIDEPKKFAFSTYEVSDTELNREAIEKNGEVTVDFYDEWVPFNTTWYTTSTPQWTTPNWSSNNLVLRTTGNVGIGTSSPNSTLTISGTTTSSAYYSNASYTSNVAGSLETGRVEAGGNSSQHFSSINGNFNSYVSNSVNLKIYPSSQKPVETSEIRNYCTNCGTRAKKTGWKFCPNCGQKI